MRITGAISVKTKAALSPFPDLVWRAGNGDRVLFATVRLQRPFDRGTIFDLNTGHAVNVDRKTRFDEAA